MSGAPAPAHEPKPHGPETAAENTEHGHKKSKKGDTAVDKTAGDTHQKALEALDGGGEGDGKAKGNLHAVKEEEEDKLVADAVKQFKLWDEKKDEPKGAPKKKEDEAHPTVPAKAGFFKKFFGVFTWPFRKFINIFKKGHRDKKLEKLH